MKPTSRNSIAPGRGARSIYWWPVLVWLLWIIASGSSLKADRIELLEGPPIEAQVNSINVQGQVLMAGSLAADLWWRDIHTIQRKVAPETSPRPQVVLYLHNQSRIYADRLIVSEGVCTFISRLMDHPVTIPLDQVRGLLLEVPENWTASHPLEEGFASALMAKENTDRDQLWVRTERGLQRVEGMLEAVTEEQIRFVWNQELRSVSLPRGYGLVLAKVAANSPTGPVITDAKILLSDGSVLFGKLMQLQGDRLHVDLGPSSVKLDWKHVQQVQAINPRLIYLSDLDPVKVIEDYFPSAGWQWQRDRAVTGQLLRWGDQSFARGLGVHAHCVLEYDLKGDFAWFLATIGLQPPTPEVGDCEFVVKGDGIELFRQRMRGNDPPREIRLAVQGVQRLSLAVEPGENFDIGDHANWAEARLLKAASSMQGR